MRKRSEELTLWMQMKAFPFPLCGTAKRLDTPPLYLRMQFHESQLLWLLSSDGSNTDQLQINELITDLLGLQNVC